MSRKGLPFFKVTVCKGQTEDDSWYLKRRMKPWILT